MWYTNEDTMTYELIYIFLISAREGLVLDKILSTLRNDDDQ